MTIYETMSGLVTAINEAKAEAMKTDKVVQEICAKIMLNLRTSQAMKEEWQSVYRAWSDFALASPLLTQREPRMTREALRDAYQTTVALKAKALTIYRVWKSQTAVSGAAPAQGVAPGVLPGVPASSGKDGRLLRGALIGAALLGGCAAGKVLIDAFRKKDAPAPILPPPPSPLARFAPSPFPMPMAQMMPALMPVPLYPQGYQQQQFEYGDED